MVVCHMLLVTVGLLILVLGTSMGTKEKSKVTRKKQIAVTDSQSMWTLEEWINLEREVLEKLCKVVKLSSDRTLTEMARSLMQFYRQLNTHSHPDTHGTSMGTQLRTRLTGLCSGCQQFSATQSHLGRLAPSANNHLPPQKSAHSTSRQTTWPGRWLNACPQPKGPPKLGHRMDWELRYDQLQRHRTYRAHNHTCTITTQTNCNHTSYTSSQWRRNNARHQHRPHYSRYYNCSTHTSNRRRGQPTSHVERHTRYHDTLHERIPTLHTANGHTTNRNTNTKHQTNSFLAAIFITTLQQPEHETSTGATTTICPAEFVIPANRVVSHDISASNANVRFHEVSLLTLTFFSQHQHPALLTCLSRSLCSKVANPRRQFVWNNSRGWKYTTLAPGWRRGIYTAQHTHTTMHTWHHNCFSTRPPSQDSANHTR